MAIITTAAFRRSDNRHMVRVGRVLTDISESYEKELIRVGLARECSAQFKAPENKAVNFSKTDGTPLSALPAGQVLQQTTENKSDNGDLPKKKGRPKKEA